MPTMSSLSMNIKPKFQHHRGWAEGANGGILDQVIGPGTTKGSAVQKVTGGDGIFETPLFV